MELEQIKEANELLKKIEMYELQINILKGDNSQLKIFDSEKMAMVGTTIPTGCHVNNSYGTFKFIFCRIEDEIDLYSPLVAALEEKLTSLKKELDEI